MHLNELINLASQKAGSQTNLAKVIGVHPNVVSEAKANKRGLPAEACGKLADLIGVDRWTVLAASNLITEKNEEKRAYWAPFVLNGISAFATAAAALLLTSASTKTYANDTLKMSDSACNTVKSMRYSDGKAVNTDYAKLYPPPDAPG
jgi:plasmid maintenance system antidote protein VapI